ncbi:NADPH oxidase organizer 1 [Amazona ochrocephala]
MAAKISQGEDVIQFFKAQTQDLDPSFPENSVVIMPSDIGGEKKAQSQLRQQQQPSCITWPQASQSYRCIETFETKDTKNKSFKVTKKEIVEVCREEWWRWIHRVSWGFVHGVLTWIYTGGKNQVSVQQQPGTELLCTMSCLLGQSRDYGHLQAVKTLSLLFAAGWWLVENADKQIAWFPASYLEEIDAHKDIQNAFCSDKEGSLYFVVRAYESQKADELSLNNGVMVEVVRKSEDGWWLIR